MAKLSVDKALLKAKSLAKKGDIAEAQKLYQAVLQAFPQNKRTQQGLITLNRKQYLVKSKNPPLELLKELVTLYHQGKLKEAIEFAKTLTELYPKASKIWNIMGAAAAQIGEPEQAIFAFQKMLLLDPNDADAHNNIGNALSIQGKLDEALIAYGKALVIKPDFADAHNNIGNTFDEQGRLKEAISAYKEALAVKPDLTQAASNLLKSHVGLLNSEDLSFCEKLNDSISTNTKNPSHLFFQANLHMHKGELDEAFNKFCSANKMKLGETKGASKDLDQAHKTLSRINEWTPDHKKIADRGLTKLFLFGPSRSGKSSLEHLLNESHQVMPLYEANKLDKVPLTRKLTFEEVFFRNEKELLHDGYNVVISTSPSSIFYSNRLIDELSRTYFVIIKRDQRDIAAEIFTNEYKKGHFYSYDPMLTIEYVNVYYELCEALKAKIPERCISLNYTELTESPEDSIDQIGQLISHSFNKANLKNKMSKNGIKSLFRNHFTQFIESLRPKAATDTTP